MPLTEFIEFISWVLYLYIAWLSGVLLGYLIGKRDYMYLFYILKIILRHETFSRYC